MDKVLVIEYCPSNQSGGAERSMRGFCEYLVAKGHSVYLGYKDEGSYVSGEEGKIYSGLLKLNVSVLTAGSAPGFLSDIFKTRNFCRKHGITAVITHVVHAAPLLRLIGSAAGVKTGMLLKWRLTTEQAGAKVRWGMAGIQRHVAVSNYTLEYWRRNGVPQDTSAVVPEGVAARNLPAPEKDGSIFHVAFAARIVHMKGLHLLFEAIARLKNEGHRIKLSVAGGFRGKESQTPDSYHCELELLLEKLHIQDIVAFLGFVDPVESLFVRSDVVVVPSILPEAQPLAIMQAMAAGALVLSSEIGGTAEVLKPEFSSFLVPPGPVDAIYSRLKEMISWSQDKRSQIAAEMKAFVIKNYQLESLLGKTAQQLNIS